MSLADRQLHAIAATGVVVVKAGLALGLVATGWDRCHGGDASAGPPALDQLEAIEASIAYKKRPARQPQKPTRRPEPTRPPEGVSHDETRPADPPKPDDRARPSEDKRPAIPDRTGSLELPVNSDPAADVGAFDDSTRPGFADVTSGDPFFRDLAGDFHDHWEFPKILSATGTAAGCLHILADGTIAQTKVDPASGDPALDDSIERALRQVEQLRNAHPVPVPTHLLKQATTRWICFKANLQDAPR